MVRAAEDIEANAVGWCPARVAGRVLWRPVTREGAALRSWRWSNARGAWVGDETLAPRVLWRARRGPIDATTAGELFELPATGADVPPADGRRPPVEGEDTRRAPDPEAPAVEAPPVADAPPPANDATPAAAEHWSEDFEERLAIAAEGGAPDPEAVARHQLGAELAPVEVDHGPAETSPSAPNDAPAGDPSRGAPGDAPAEHAPAPFVPWQSAPFPALTSARGPGRRYVPRDPLPDDAAAVRRALVDPEAVAAALGLCEGVQGWGRGAGWTRIAGGVLVQCPAHGDRTPSCSVTRGPDGTLRVRCFGCDLAGDALHLVAAVYGLDARAHFVRVLEHAAHLAGVRLSTPGDRAPIAPPPRRPAPAPDPAPSNAALAPDVFAALVRALLAAAPLDGPHAADVRAYLDARGILDAARADGWGALPSGMVAQGDVRARIVAAVGVEAWEASGLAHPRDPLMFAWGSTHRVVIPWRNVDGEPVWLQRRAVGRFDGPRYVAPAGTSPAAPYGAHQLAALPLDAPAALVEGAVDALALRAACEVDGSPFAVLGLPGVKGWRRPWGALLAGRPVAIALDGDAAGDAAADVIARELAGLASNVNRWRPAGGAKDWGEAWEQRKATARAS